MEQEIDPFSIDYIHNQIGRMIRPLVHRNMTMREWLRINSLTYEIIEDLLPSYFDSMVTLNKMRKQLSNMATHRYLIIPFTNYIGE